jgi:hypothetical protein
MTEPFKPELRAHHRDPKYDERQYKEQRVSLTPEEALKVATKVREELGLPHSDHFLASRAFAEKMLAEAKTEK